MKQIKTIFSKKESYILIIGWIVVLLVNYLPYIKRGIPGNVIDMIYQLERIEGLKDSIKEGIFLPRIYERFFYGYGYGSPLFYSDFYFIIPALLRVAGFSATQSLKLFIILIVTVNYFTSFCCFRAVFKKFDAAFLGTILLVLSQYYLMDLSLRIGLGEYIAAIFVPVLFLGIYDYFVNDARKVYLFGIAFGGMLLAHTIMVFLGAIITILAFVIALISKKYRKNVFVGKNVLRLCLTALATLAVTAFYFIPMLEQMAFGRFGFNTPWTNIGDFVPSLLTIFYPKGSMFFVCEGGIGVAIWAFLLYCMIVFCVNRKRESNATEGFFLILMGIVMSVMLTNVFPWKVFNNSIMNSIQFTFRFLPYVLNLMVFGGVSVWNKEERNLTSRLALIGILLLAVGFGIYQNVGVDIDEATYTFDDEFLNSSGTLYVGRGEWMPEVLEVEAFLQRLATEPEMLEGIDYVKYESKEMGTFERQGGNTYAFDIFGDTQEVTVPLIYYKGYRAFIKEGNSKIYLNVKADEEGFVEILNESHLDGRVCLKYFGTPVQKISVWVSVFTVLSLIGALFWKGKRKSNE